MRFDGLETDESRQHWVEDMDVDVSAVQCIMVYHPDISHPGVVLGRRPAAEQQPVAAPSRGDRARSALQGGSDPRRALATALPCAAATCSLTPYPLPTLKTPHTTLRSDAALHRMHPTPAGEAPPQRAVHPPQGPGGGHQASVHPRRGHGRGRPQLCDPGK